MYKQKQKQWKHTRLVKGVPLFKVRYPKTELILEASGTKHRRDKKHKHQTKTLAILTDRLRDKRTRSHHLDQSLFPISSIMFFHYIILETASEGLG